MENAECPQCSEKTITLMQKIKAGKWATIYCPSCNCRMCASPVMLAMMYFVLTWIFLFFGYLAVRESDISYALMMIVGWLIMEFFIYYIPLSRMRSLNNNSE